MYGFLDCVKYGRENGYKCDNSSMICAAMGGYLECMEYLYKCGCPWSVEVCYCAMSNKHMACLKFARDNGCKWDVTTTIASARDLDRLIYVLNDGGECNQKVFNQALYCGRLDCLMYLHKNNYTYDKTKFP